MNEKEKLEVIWCALNAMIPRIEIMHAIEKVTGKRPVTRRWARYFDSNKTTADAVQVDLKRLNAKK